MNRTEKIMADQPAQQFPWWLESSSGRCAGCDVRVHVELLIYCVACDRPFCPLCIVAIRRSQELSCHGCEVHDPVDAVEES
jgi:hypothetical protein